MQRLELLVSPAVESAEAVFTGCVNGRKRQSVVVDKPSLRRLAQQIDGSLARIELEERRERDPEWPHTMGFSESTQSFGIGHAAVKAFGPNGTGGRGGEYVHDELRPAEEVRGRLCVRIWTRRRGYPAFVVLVDRPEAEGLALTLRRAADSDVVRPYSWVEEAKG